MVFEGLMNLIGTVLGAICKVVPGIDFDTSKLGQSLQLIVDYAKGLNGVLPIKEAIAFGMIAISIKIALFAFWGAMRIINLIRGAG